jgi:hypothetical protein
MELIQVGIDRRIRRFDDAIGHLGSDFLPLEATMAA